MQRGILLMEALCEWNGQSLAPFSYALSTGLLPATADPLAAVMTRTCARDCH